MGVRHCKGNPLLHYPKSMSQAQLQAVSEGQERREGGGKVDISREFCCFLSNGFMMVLGAITLEPAFVRLSTANG